MSLLFDLLKGLVAIVFDTIKELFRFFRYLLPFSSKRHRYYQRQAKQQLHTLRTHAQRDNPAYGFGLLRHTNPYVFEELLLLCFKEAGFKVTLNRRYSNDGGIDGTLHDAQGRKIVVQAKRYRQAINPAHVKDFAQTIIRHGAHRGIFIHTGRTGLKSYQHRTLTIDLVSGKRLWQLIRHGQYQAPVTVVKQAS